MGFNSGFKGLMWHGLPLTECWISADNTWWQY